MAAGASFLITEDVDDYGSDDLAGVGVSAVNPDLFLAERLTREAYETVIALFVERQVNPPTSPAQFHAAIARQHPRLFAAHADLYDVEPRLGVHPEPATVSVVHVAFAVSGLPRGQGCSLMGSARSAAEPMRSATRLLTSVWRPESG